MPPLAVPPGAAADADIDWHSLESCVAYCDRRRDRLRKDEEALELMRDRLLRTQKETIVQGLCKLNKDVKNLTIKEFNEAFGCDVVDLIGKRMTSSGANAGGGAAVASGGQGKKRPVATAAGGGSGGLSFKTPAASRMRSGKAPMTTRTARKGETVKM